MTRTLLESGFLYEKYEENHSAGVRLGRNRWLDGRSLAFMVENDAREMGQPLENKLWQRVLPILDQGKIGSCFPPGTRVRMADGSERPIQDVRLGERVVTAEGGTGRVVRSLLRDEDGGLVRLILWGHSHLRMTSEHPVLTARGYVAANELRVGDEVALPRYVSEQITENIQPRDLVRRHTQNAVTLPDKIALDRAFGRLYGLWLAEGSADGTKVRWHYGAHEATTLVAETVELCRLVLGVDVHAVERPSGNWWVTLYGTPWNALFKSLGGQRVESKRMHPLMTSGPQAFLSAVLDGWLAGDGHVRPDGSHEGVTVSDDLALGMYDIAQAIGRHPVLVHSPPVVNRAARSRLWRWTLTIAPGKGRCRETERHVWRAVREIRLEDYVGAVYDLTVEGDHSYVAEGVGVHNCTGNAGTGALGTEPLYSAVGKSVLPTSGSAGDGEEFALTLYEDATAADGYPGTYPPDDTGSSGLAICKVLKSRQTIARFRWARTPHGFLRLLQSGPVLQGMPWYNAFFQPDHDGFIDADPRWSGSGLAGGHEVEAVGVEIDFANAFNSVLVYANSWSSSWGDNGYFRMRLHTYEELSGVDLKQMLAS